MPQVTADQVIELARTYDKLMSARLNANTVTRADELGAYGCLLVDDDGDWAGDASARARSELSFAVDRWLSDNPDQPQSGFTTDLAELRARRPQIPAQVRAAAVRLLWGISAPARRGPAIARELGIDAVDPGTIRTWPRVILTEPVLIALGERAERFPHRDVPPKLTGGPAKWKFAPLNLPPDGQESERLIDRARGFLPPEERYWVRDGMPDVIENRVWTHSDTDVVAAIRRLAGEALQAQYLIAPESDFDRDIARGVLDAWADADVLLFQPVPLTERQKTRVSGKVGAALQLFCNIATADEPGTADAMTAELRRRRVSKRVVDADEAAARLAEFERQATIAEEERWIALDVKRDADRAADGAALLGLAPSITAFRSASPPAFTAPDDPTMRLYMVKQMWAKDALRASNSIREEKNLQAKMRDIEMYIEKRRRLLSDPTARELAGSELSRRTFSLADQGVHLEAMNTRDRPLSNAMARIIGSDHRASYSLLAPRNLALDASKVGDHESAVAAIDQVYIDAMAKSSAGAFSDTQERLETLHQIALAATGILVTTVEDRTVSRETEGDEVLGTYVRALLEWSGLLERYLAELRTHVRGDPEARHRDGHIFWRDWIVTTALNRNRALLISRLAVKAVKGMVLDGEMTRAIRIGSLKDGYRKLLLLDELRPGSEKVLTMQGTFLAMLNGGWLPAVSDTTRTAAGMTLLDARKAEHRGDPPEFRLRHHASAEWHIRNRDGGLLSRVTRSSLGWSHLKKQSGTTFTEWYDTVEGAGLMPARGAPVHRPMHFRHLPALPEKPAPPEKRD